MKAKVTGEFKALRHPNDKKNSNILVGEIVDGALAEAAIGNGYGKQVSDDTPVTRAVKPVTVKAATKGGKGGNQKRGRQDDDGGSGEDGEA